MHAHFVRLLAAASTVITISPALAETCSVSVSNQVVQLAYPSAMAAVVYMQITNPCESKDRLTNSASQIAASTEIHKSSEDEDGVMSMSAVDGVDVLPMQQQLLEPGGYHVMLMGLDLPQGTDSTTIVLTFEKGGRVEVTAPIRIGVQ